MLVGSTRDELKSTVGKMPGVEGLRSFHGASRTSSVSPPLPGLVTMLCAMVCNKACTDGWYYAGVVRRDAYLAGVGENCFVHACGRIVL